jgi:hypothetical protein
MIKLGALNCPGTVGGQLGAVGYNRRSEAIFDSGTA